MLTKNHKKFEQCEFRNLPTQSHRANLKTNHFVFSEIDKVIVSEQIPSALSTKNIQERIRVPNVLGKSLKKAIAILSSAGLRVKVDGSGQVIDQFPKPGRLSKNSKLCILTLK